MPTRTFPAKPSLEQFKHQAKDLMKAREAGDLAALQRIREFHPRFGKATDNEISAAQFKLSDAQLAIAREYGFPTWPRLRQRTGLRSIPGDQTLLHHERIKDPFFRRAIDLLDAGEEAGLRAHLSANPTLARQHVHFEGENYFRNPTLLDFIAENPIRHAKLPPNIVQIARIILDAGANKDQAIMDSALGLVCSGRVPRECGLQIPLINLLCECGANANEAVLPALGHGEFQAVTALLAHGAKLDLAVAAATGRVGEARRLLPPSSKEDRHRALALAAQFGHTDIVRLLLDIGENPNRYNPVGCHSHSTPLHQAAWNGHLHAVSLLVERGARLDLRDIVFQGTPLNWATQAGQTAVADFLQAKASL